MDQQPAWLHHEGSYRVYVRGARFALIGFTLAAAFGALASSDVIGQTVPLAGLLAAFVLAFSAILASIIGLLTIPDKDRARRHQAALLSMVAHDIFRGLPPRAAGSRPL